MINELSIDKIASYKKISKISPAKKISLIYGLNGSGKSTISNYLYNPTDPLFSSCKIVEDAESEILVYNQRFLSDYFHVEDNLKGIFTLSKENKDALVEIERKTQDLTKIEEEKTRLDNARLNIDSTLETEKTNASNKVWEIKTKYTGGDRVLEYCLEGLKRTEALFNHIINLSLPDAEPTDTIETLKNEVAALEGEKAIKIEKLKILNFSGEAVENHLIFTKIIVGSQQGSVAEFINDLESSDWVKTGLTYIPSPLPAPSYPCPFCQENTITQTLLDSIKNIFDASYEKDISTIELQKANYNSAEIDLTLPEIDDLIVVDTLLAQKWKTAKQTINSIYRENKLLIDSKIKNPSTPIELKASNTIVSEIKNLTSTVNDLIDAHNGKLDNKKQSMQNIKLRFWNLMRWTYDQTLSAYKTAETRIKEELLVADLLSQDNSTNLSNAKTQLIALRKTTVNIEEAIENINNGLDEIGAVGFSVVKHSENLYRISRTNADQDVFHSLSEGEKTVISFLYFLELCRGQRSATSAPKKKIVVIDDPISSLSHIYVFNIGQLIKKTFFNSPHYEQIFVLTHSLYFFYELTHTNKEKRNDTQNLYRIIKNSTGSTIIQMKYEEIQNDYQSYWSIIKDESAPPALIANCMRNVIEYFFNFVQKRDFNNVFQKPVLASDKHQAFYRYMNRESHSLGQNIFDIKEFDYSNFKEGLRLVFDECGYIDHYTAMMK